MASHIRSLRQSRLDDEQAQHRSSQEPRTRTTSWTWSQPSVAQRLGWPVQTYSDCETGKRAITVDDLICLAYIFDLAPASLMLPPKPTSRTRIDVVSPKSGTVLTSSSLSDYMTWMRGLQPLAGQNSWRFRASNSSWRRYMDKADARVTTDPRTLTTRPPQTDGDPEAIALLKFGHMLGWIRRGTLDKGFEEGLEYLSEDVDDAVTAYIAVCEDESRHADKGRPPNPSATHG